MAVKASAELTVTDQTDATALVEWHCASASAAKPSAPTTTQAGDTPAGWSKSEPTVASESDLANYDYTCLQLVWGDGTCSWGEVQLSAAYEAAKVAWNAAHAASEKADSIQVGGRNLFALADSLPGYPAARSSGAYSIVGQSSSKERYAIVPVVAGTGYVFQYWNEDQSTYRGWYCVQELDSDKMVLRQLIRSFPTTNYSTLSIKTGGSAAYLLVSAHWLEEGYRHVSLKLERGTLATDWTPAPEDQALAADSVEYIVGTQTGTTGAWTGVTRDSALYTGKTIAYRLPYAGSGNATLNLTLSGGGTTGAKEVYINNTRVTTHFAANSVNTLTYDGTRWRAQGYWTGNDTAMYIKYYNTVKAGNAWAAESIIGGKSDGRFYNIALSPYQFELDKPLLWTTVALAENKTNYANLWTQVYDRNLGTYYASMANGAGNSIVYLVGTVSGNTFTLDGTTPATYLACTPPSSDDGKAYVPIGRLGNQSTGKNYFNFCPGVPVTLYAYRDGAFGPVSIREAAAAAKTATNYITSDSTGIKVHMAGNSTTYQHQSASATTYYVNSDKRAEVGADGLKVYVGSHGSEVSVAEFGSAARVGASAGPHVVVDSGGMDVYCDSTHRLVRVTARSDTHKEGKVDFGSDIGFLSGEYDTEWDEHRLTLQGTRHTSLRGPNILIEASGLDTATYGDSHQSASAEMRADRTWTSDGSKTDRAGVGASVSYGGSPPSSYIEAASGDALGARVAAESSASHDTVEFWCDRLEILDSKSDVMASVGIYPTHGSVGQSNSVAAGGYADVSVSFGHTYESAPHVVVGLMSTSNAGALGSCSVAVKSVTTTGFTARLFNAGTTARSPGFHWIAIG